MPQLLRPPAPPALESFLSDFTRDGIAVYRYIGNADIYRLSVIGFGQISVIGYRLNLTDMPSLVFTSFLQSNLKEMVYLQRCFLQEIEEKGHRWSSDKHLSTKDE